MFGGVGGVRGADGVVVGAVFAASCMLMAARRRRLLSVSASSLLSVLLSSVKCAAARFFELLSFLRSLRSN